MNKLISEHFRKLAKFQVYEIESEEDKWYLCNYEKAQKIKNEVMNKANVSDDLIILGDNKFGSLLITFNKANEDNVYSLEINKMKIRPTEMKLVDLI